MGDFVVTDAPEIDAEHSDVERLADAIRRHPGQSKHSLVQGSGVRWAKARALLDRFDGELWRTQAGPHNSRLFFPLDDQPERNEGA
ncbi:MAG TPA: hypothetical protein VEJ38_05890 [Candidatus Acidoferrales bacterium]|nr:hypothetical protein [Candidatus Acidoferrales bacterium]